MINKCTFSYIKQAYSVNTFEIYNDIFNSLIFFPPSYYHFSTNVDISVFICIYFENKRIFFFFEINKKFVYEFTSIGYWIQQQLALQKSIVHDWKACIRLNRAKAVYFILFSELIRGVSSNIYSNYKKKKKLFISALYRSANLKTKQKTYLIFRCTKVLRTWWFY